MPPETVSTQSEVASQLPPTPPKNNRDPYIFLGVFTLVIIGGIVVWAYMPQFTEHQNDSIPQTQTNSVDPVSENERISQAQTSSIAPVSENERIQIFSKFFPSFMQNPLVFSDYTLSAFDGLEEYHKGYSARYLPKQGNDWAEVSAASVQDSSTIFQAVNSMANNPGRNNSDLNSSFADQINVRNLVRNIMAAHPKLIDAPYGPMLFGSAGLGPDAAWVSVDKTTGKPILVLIHFFPFASYGQFEMEDRERILSGEDAQNFNATLQFEIIKTYYEKYPSDLQLTKQLEQTLQDVYTQNRSHAFRVTMDSNVFSAFDRSITRENAGGNKFDFAYYIDEPDMSRTCDWAVFYPEQASSYAPCEALVTTAAGKTITINDSSFPTVGGFPQKWLDDHTLLFSAEFIPEQVGDTQGVQGTYDVVSEKTTHLMKYLRPENTSTDYQIETNGKQFLFQKSAEEVNVYLVPNTFTDFVKYGNAFDSKNVSALQQTGSFDLVQDSYVWLEITTDGNLKIFVGRRYGYGQSDEVHAIYELLTDTGKISTVKTSI